jgi:ABC-2 type transport system ATP-binding protein
MMKTIEAHNLTRDYNGLRAVDGINFSVEPGEIFGFLGPNGAGKTTTIRMLTGQLRPTSGNARVMNCDVVNQRQELKPQIGVVVSPGQLAFLRTTIPGEQIPRGCRLGAGRYDG